MNSNAELRINGFTHRSETGFGNQATEAARQCRRAADNAKPCPRSCRLCGKACGRTSKALSN